MIVQSVVDVLLEVQKIQQAKYDIAAAIEEVCTMVCQCEWTIV